MATVRLVRLALFPQPDLHPGGGGRRPDNAVVELVVPGVTASAPDAAAASAAVGGGRVPGAGGRAGLDGSLVRRAGTRLAASATAARVEEPYRDLVAAR